MNSELIKINNLKTLNNSISSESDNTLPPISNSVAKKCSKKRKKKKSYKSLMSDITSSKTNSGAIENKNIVDNTGGGVFSKLDRI